MCDPVGIVEIAERLEVSRHTVHKWRQRRVMPEPRWTVGGGPCWDWPDVQVWAFHSRRRGRGPDKAARVVPGGAAPGDVTLAASEASRGGNGSLKPVGDPVAKPEEEFAKLAPLFAPLEQAAGMRWCVGCKTMRAIDQDGALVEHQLPPGRVRHDGSTLCPGAP